MVEKAIIARLKGFAGLTALVSQRIYSAIAPQGVVSPYVTLFRVSAGRESAMGADIGIVRARIQVNSWGTTYASAKDTAEQVRGALQRFSGTSASIVVLDIFILAEQDLYEPDTLIHHIATDIEVLYRE